MGVNDGGSRAIQAIKGGEVSTLMEFESATDIQGVSAIGSANVFMTTGGTDLAQDGELYRGSRGVVRMVADLGEFERNNDPDAFEGPQWKDQACEAIDGFSAGPQNNPFHVTVASGGAAFVADAAGNTVLKARTNGDVDWVALFTPPLDANGDRMIRWNGGTGSDPIPCYVQPVPTSIAIGPNGDLYIGELTGTLAPEDGVFPIGLSRVWKVSSGAENVVCSEQSPSPDCELFIDGLTSVIDVAFGPDANLYVVEYDEFSWLAAFVPGTATGGTISSYDLDGNLVEIVAQDLEFPSAITFDKWGNLWLLENNATGVPPTVRQIEMS